MKTRPDVEKRVQEALDSLDGIQRAEPQPFFYTRLMARLQRDQKTIWETIGSFLAKPVVALAGLAFILVLNVFIVSRRNSNTNPVSPMSVVEEIKTDNDYVIASSSSFEYENIDQQ